MVRKLKEELKDVHEKEVEKLKKESNFLNADIKAAHMKVCMAVISVNSHFELNIILR